MIHEEIYRKTLKYSFADISLRQTYVNQAICQISPYREVSCSVPCSTGFESGFRSEYHDFSQLFLLGFITVDSSRKISASYFRISLPFSFEVLGMMFILYAVTPCSPVESLWGFSGKYCLHLHGRNKFFFLCYISLTSITKIDRWNSTQLHDVTSKITLPSCLSYYSVTNSLCIYAQRGLKIFIISLWILWIKFFETNTGKIPYLILLNVLNL
jgi:hypothetical protein